MKQRAMFRFNLPVTKPGEPPPEEFRIFTLSLDGKPNFITERKRGVVEEFTFDQASGEAVMSAYERRRLPLKIDWEHASHLPIEKLKDGGAPAAAWFDLELRADGLWAINVAWTPKAARQLANREYALFSPVITFDEHNHVDGLIDLALTNDPATNDMPPLVAASIPINGLPDRMAASVSQGRIVRLTARLDSEVPLKDTPNEREIHTMATKLGDHLTKKMAEHSLTPEQLAAHCGIGVDSYHKLMEAAPGELAPEHHQAMRKLAEKIGTPVHHLRAMAMNEDLEEGTDAAADDAGGGHRKTEEEKVEEQADQGGDKPVEPQVKKFVADQIRLATKDKDEQIALLKQETTKLRGDVKKQADETFKKELDLEVSAALSAGKLVGEDDDKWARDFGKKFGLEELRAALAVRQVQAPNTFRERQPGDPSKEAPLTAEEVKFAKKSGNTPKELAMFKAQLENDEALRERFPGFRPSRLH